jgi:peptide/nickel transport system substrate-binding protein
MLGFARALSRGLAIVFLATACAAPARAPMETAPGSTAPATPKKITIAVVANVSTLVDRMSAGGVGIPGLTDLEKLISPGLAIFDDRGGLRPLFVEAAPSIENGLWISLPDGRMQTTWKVKPNALWHDGTPLTSADVVFTATVDQDTDVPMRRTLAYASVDSVEAPDPQTVTVHWKRPYIQADTLFTTPLFPRHLLERPYLEGKATFAQLPYWTDEFVGTGPYKVREYARGTHMVLDANDRYVAGRPKIDEIEVRFIPDQNALAANVLAGAVDLTLGRGVSLEQALQIRDHWRDGGVDIAFTSWLVIYPQFLNPTPAIVGELQFRRALMHATDRQAMAESLQAGLVPVAHAFLHPNEPEYRELEASIVRYDYDPRRATQLIEDLGYTRGADGVFRDAANQRLALELRTSPEQDIQVKTLLTLADHWQRVGVAADPVVMAEQRVRDREYVQTFPAFLMYRQPNDPNGLLLRLYSAQTPLPANDFVGRNHPRYMNPEFDALLDRYYTTLPRADRTRVLGQVVNHTTERLTLMGLFYDVEPIAVGRRLVNVAAGKTADSTPVWNADQWDVR